ncbi:MAG: hypothetical protein ACO4CZ_19875, partial [Planctomycetota bacterium]
MTKFLHASSGCRGAAAEEALLGLHTDSVTGSEPTSRDARPRGRAFGSLLVFGGLDRDRDHDVLAAEVQVDV